MPKPFGKVTAIAAPIMRSNIDTDVIMEIPFAARWENGRSARCVICPTVRRTPNSS
jgi:3-isopropylmalate dehydratase small subunit